MLACSPVLLYAPSLWPLLSFQACAEYITTIVASYYTTACIASSGRHAVCRHELAMVAAVCACCTSYEEGLCVGA